jgi:hypothetical protein
MQILENLLQDQAQLGPIGKASNAPPTLLQDAGAEAEYDVNSTSAASDNEDEIQETPGVPRRFLTEMEVEATLPSTGQASARDVSSQPQGAMQSGIATSPETPGFSILLRQREALEKTLAILKRFCQSSSPGDWNIASDGNFNDGKSIYDLSPSDITNILTTPHTATSFLYSPSLMLPWPTIKMMGLSFLDGQDQNDHKALQHNVILNFEAAIILGHQTFDKRDTNANKIQAHIELVKMQKLHNSLAKLDRISFRAPPSLSLLQAQCIGVAMLQYFGNIPEAWSMMAAVSRTFVALGFDNIDGNRPVSRGEDVEGSIAWCYQLDRSMSLILKRPPLLPRTSNAPTLSPSPSSDETETGSAKLDLVQILLEFAHIQGYISFATAGATVIPWKDIELVHSTLIQLYSKIENVRIIAPGKAPRDTY